jgi:hypothetical protein
MKTLLQKTNAIVAATADVYRQMAWSALRLVPRLR